MQSPFIRPDVRQFLDYLESLNRPKGYEIGAEAARKMMLASRHAFESAEGAVFEEISSTHFVDDSFYTDPAIAKNRERKTFLRHWMS